LALPRACLQACSCELELPPCLALPSSLASPPPRPSPPRCLPPCKLSGRGALAGLPPPPLRTSERRRGHANAREPSSSSSSSSNPGAHPSPVNQAVREVRQRTAPVGRALLPAAAACWRRGVGARERDGWIVAAPQSVWDAVGHGDRSPPPLGDVYWLSASLPRVCCGQALLSLSLLAGLGPQWLPTCDCPLATRHGQRTQHGRARNNGRERRATVSLPTDSATPRTDAAHRTHRRLG
jgi:hypothetical protein